MTKINRNLATATQSSYDVIIIGGGIYGVMLSLEASRRNLRSLLIEKGDFGGATSYNSLRIVHGGFRYLQNLDLERFYESVGERKWFLKTFPELVKPLSCLMPLYNKGIRRPPILYTALKLNDALSINRNQGIRPDRHLPPGKVIKSEQVKTHFPTVDTQGLTGGAIWHDACMPDSQRL
ncbi:MAG: FAD-dependent oxidoreductase, partial [Planktothrix sp.]